MRLVRAGSVLKILNKDISPAKYKYSVCVLSSCERPLFFLINTENRKMYDCIPILKSAHGFLSHDSYISCNRVFEYNKEAIEAASNMGRLTTEQTRYLIAHIEKSKYLPKDILNDILLSLRESLSWQ